MQIRRASGSTACEILGLALAIAIGVFIILLPWLKGSARGHLASNLVPSISIKRPLKSIKNVDFTQVLPLVAADGDWHFWTCVGTEERFRCTGALRERFWHFQKVCDFNVRWTVPFQNHWKTIGFISKIDKRMLQQCSPKGLCFPCLMTQPQGSPKLPPIPPKVAPI